MMIGAVIGLVVGFVGGWFVCMKLAGKILSLTLKDKE